MKKNRFTTALLVIFFFAGVFLLVYPSVSNYWNSFHQSRAISSYAEQVAAISPEEYDRYLQEARDYNANILRRAGIYAPSEEEKKQYNDLLNISGNGVMGYIEIPAIDVALPIYHGTSDTVLQVAVGHLDWTSLPVGGLDTHCVLSGHRGLPSAKLFTNLDKLVEGDVFMIRVLDEVLTYEVDQISIVLPENASELQIVRGQDYCTLVTCTPYGINTHRLLVRGHRIENAQQAASVHIVAEAFQIDSLLVAAVLSVPALLVVLVLMFAIDGKHGNRAGKPSRKKKKHE